MTPESRRGRFVVAIHIHYAYVVSHRRCSQNPELVVIIMRRSLFIPAQACSSHTRVPPYQYYKSEIRDREIWFVATYVADKLPLSTRMSVIVRERRWRFQRWPLAISRPQSLCRARHTIWSASFLTYGYGRKEHFALRTLSAHCLAAVAQLLTELCLVEGIQIAFFRV